MYTQSERTFQQQSGGASVPSFGDEASSEEDESVEDPNHPGVVSNASIGGC